MIKMKKNQSSEADETNEKGEISESNEVNECYMMNKRKNSILWLLTLLPLIITIVVMPLMPNKVPMHYTAGGHVNRWGSKYENLGFPIFTVAMMLFMECFIIFYSKKQNKNISDKEKKEAANNVKVIYITTLCMSVMFGVLQLVILYIAYDGAKNHSTHTSVDVGVVTNILIGMLLIILGNFMPKTKRNATVGLRTVWSMENDITWAKSNRIGGISLMISGIIILLSTCFVHGGPAFIVTIGVVLLDTIFSVVASYYIYKKYKN